jgi:sortase A
MTVRRTLRITGTVLVVAGVLGLIWVVIVWRWQDPFTALYTYWKQRQLSSSYHHRFDAYRASPAVRTQASLAGRVRAISEEARRYRLSSHRGEAIGRIRVPRLHVNMVLVNGTDHDSLMKGPGRDLRTYMPGEGQLIYIAGHRTTYLAPFAHIDSMQRGDLVTLAVPYGTFVYRVFRHRIVDSHDLAVLHSHGREVVELQACHPRFFATQRYIVYGQLVRIDPRGAASFTPPTRTLAAAPLAAREG